MLEDSEVAMWAWATTTALCKIKDCYARQAMKYAFFLALLVNPFFYVTYDNFSDRLNL